MLLSMTNPTLPMRIAPAATIQTKLALDLNGRVTLNERGQLKRLFGKSCKSKHVVSL